MNRIHRRRRQAVVLAASTTLVAAGLFASTTAGAAAPAPKERAPKAVVAAAQNADRDHGHVPEETWDLALKRQAQKEAAIQRLIQGKKPFKGNGKGQRVPLTLEGTDRVFVIIAEFSDHAHPSFCSAEAVEGQPAPCAFPSDGTPQTYDGPEHNAIPEPDRAVDNSTLWQADYNRAHYEDMYFNRMKEYYETQSSGRYSIAGEVTDWVKVPFNEARYGRDACGGIVCNNTWFLLRDAMSVWTQDRLDEGWEMPDIQEYLATFDIQDRYDLDNDEVYDEPDGAIDHMQIVHAGGDQAAGDPTFGTDAIWSHRWRAALTSRADGLPGFEIGSGGPTGDTTVPNNPTGMWVSDYTIQPENGGLGVFAHEYGHDLGLPDLYDTSGNTGGAENNTAFWTLMSSGANIGDGGPDGIGDAPTDMGTWELLQLGWLEAQGGNGPFYDTVPFGESRTAVLSNNTPAYDNGLQSLIVALPAKTETINVGAPFAGSWQYYSDQGNSMTTRMVKTGVTGTEPDGEGALRDRGGLGLRVRRGLQRQRSHVAAGAHQPVRCRQRERLQRSGQRHQRRPGQLDRPHGHAPGRDERRPVPLPHRRGLRDERLPGRQHRHRRRADRHGGEPRRGLGPRRLPPHRLDR